MKFPTYAVLSVSTGRLLGDIGGFYKVVSFLIGRDAYTHDLAFYGKAAASALRAALPELPGQLEAAHVTKNNYGEVLAIWEKKFSSEIDLPDSLRDCLADDKTAKETLTEMVGPSKFIVVER